MKKIPSHEIEKKFNDFFQLKEHESMPSSSLIPNNKDSGVLFNIAGMQPLMEYFLGKEHPLGKRLTNTQKCLRTVDIDEVGDATHLTFFEMLGNWSLDDYFKEDSIKWSWEFLTSEKWLGIDPRLLSVTVFEGDNNSPRDDESAEIWKKQGVPNEKIAYLPAEDNWWAAGDTGPCGPDTEIFYRIGQEELPPVESNVKNDENNWMEIWNNVFIEFNKIDDNTLVKLPKKHVDTGMGLERITTALSGKKTIYETDLFVDIVSKLKEILKIEGNEHSKSIRIISDHTRAAVNLIADGVKPKNVEQGYILRRLIRRAIREAYKVNYEKPLLNQIGPIFIEQFKNRYESVNENKEKILEELEKEELNFAKTIKKGLKELEKIITKKGKDKIINGDEAFRLFDTFGFPIEITVEVAKDKGFQVDIDGFHSAYKKHQERSRAGNKNQNKGGLVNNSQNTIAMHTACHLLLAGLRETLGEHVHQAGSNINEKRIRFDFDHEQKVTLEEIEKIQKYVNDAILDNLTITSIEITKEEASNKNIEGSFWEKYPDIVKVYQMTGESGKIYSEELCGGPHLQNSDGMGKFEIKKEGSSGKGIRRIKAILKK